MVIGHREIGNPRFLIFTYRKTKKKNKERRKTRWSEGMAVVGQMTPHPRDLC
jgi:hypothetical protein